MPLMFRYNREASVVGRGGDYVVICDHCGTEVPQNEENNVESVIGAPEELVPVLFYHYDCSFTAQQQRGMKSLWRKLVKLQIETK